MDGYFNIHRQIFESWVFADDKAFKIWVWLIGKARHKPGIVPLKIGKGTTTVKLKVGQLLFGRFSAEEVLNLDGSLIYRKLKKFEVDGMIKIQSNNQYSVITICKYVDYQDTKKINEQPTNSKRTASEQQANTNNKENKENKEKKNDFFDDSDINKLFIEHLKIRVKLKAVNSDLAVNKLISKLRDLSNSNKDVAIKILENSITNSWKSYFPLK